MIWRLGVISSWLTLLVFVPVLLLLLELDTKDEGVVVTGLLAQ